MKKMQQIIIIVLISWLVIACDFNSSEDKSGASTATVPPTENNQTDPVENNQTGDILSQYTPQIVLKEGDYWKYKWQEVQTSYAEGESATVTTYFDTFTLTLGAKVVVNGVEAFPLVLSGEGDTHTPRWRYLSLADDGSLLGSSGDAFETIYSATENVWYGGGFFINFKDTDAVTVRSTTYNGIYNSFEAQELTFKDSSGGCEYILDHTLCSESSADTAIQEYYKQGLGPVGLFEHSYYTYSGGGYETAFKKDLYIELVESSLTALDGTVLKTPSWKEIATLPTKVSMQTVAIMDNKIYISNANSNVLQVYNLTTEAFETTLSLPTTSVRVHLHNLDHTLFGLSYEGGVEKLMDTGSWVYVNSLSDYDPAMTTYRFLENNETFSYILKMAGGDNLAVELFDPNSNLWSTFNNPQPNSNKWRAFKIVTVNNTLYVVGGFYLSNPTWNTWSTYKGIARFDILNNSWLAEITPPRLYKSGFALLDYEEGLVILGGKDSEGKVLSTVDRYDSSSDTWEQLEALPEPMSDIQAVCVDKKIYLISSEKIWVYTP